MYIWVLTPGHCCFSLLLISIILPGKGMGGYCQRFHLSTLVRAAVTCNNNNLCTSEYRAHAQRVQSVCTARTFFVGIVCADGMRGRACARPARRVDNGLCLSVFGGGGES